MNDKKQSTLTKIAIVAGFTALAIAGCTSPDTARSALDNAGFKDIKTGGYAPFACSKDDIYSTKFTAVNENNKAVSGTVCKGLLKGSTIRFDDSYKPL